VLIARGAVATNMPIAALFVTHEKKLFRCYAGFGGDGATRADCRNRDTL
jgi:hypothetical protein